MSERINHHFHNHGGTRKERADCRSRILAGYGPLGDSERPSVVTSSEIFGEDRDASDDMHAVPVDLLQLEPLVVQDGFDPRQASGRVEAGDKVHQNYYNWVPGVECMDVVKRFSFADGSVIKYLWRAGRKPGVPRSVDLAKAYQSMRESLALELGIHVDQLDTYIKENGL